MSRVRQQAVLIVLGAAALGLAITVYVRNRGIDDHLLATIGLIGGLAIIINSLPTRNGE